MKHTIKITLLLSTIVFLGSCKKYLDYQPQGALTPSQVLAPDKVEGLATAAYAGISNDLFDGTITHMWVYGSIRSDDAYKGGGGINDLQQYDKYEQFYLLNPSNNGGGAGGFPLTWTRGYAAISRANAALRALNSVTDAQFPERKIRIGEMHFLRGHMLFVLKELFKNIPIFDETLSDADILKVSNTQYSNDSSWEKIAGDFQVAIDNLPLTQPEPGRADQLAAKAYMAKVRLFQAYTQDAQNNVTGIDQTKLAQVISLTNDVINSGIYKLNDDFAKNFLDGYDNGPESVFAIQYSINDGTAIGGRLSMSTGLNYFAGAAQYGCCAFHIPSQNMVNAFKTDVGGLPMFTTFNTPGTEMVNPADFLTNGVDPRIDHTVGIADHPFKYDPAIPYEHSWERDAGDYGGFGTMKELQLASCACFKKLGPFYGTSVNWDIIRYADVLLWQAEAQIQSGNPAAATPLINQVRERAAKISPLVKKADGTYPSNYRISTYVPGSNIPVWDQQTAFTALQWERRMEFAMEGSRFFDLVRWGIAAETLNSYFEIEKVRHPFLNNARFTKGTHEYMPIPQQEIQFTNGLYAQNNGYH